MKTTTKFRTRHPVWFGLGIVVVGFFTLVGVAAVWFVWALSTSTWG
jgi:hypothetical protein